MSAIWLWFAFALAAPVGGEPFASSAQDLLAMPAWEREDGPAEWVEVLHEEARYTVDEQGRLTEALWRVYRVIDEGAIEDWGSVQAEWRPWYQERPEIRARVVRPDGQAFTLDPADLVEVSASDGELVYSDRRRIRAPLPQVVEGAVVEEHIVLRDSQPRLAEGSGRLIEAYVPLAAQVRVVVEVARGVPLSWTAHGVEVEPKRRHGGRTLIFELPGLEARPPWPPLAPADTATWPVLRFTTGTDWGPVAKAYHARFAEAATGALPEAWVEAVRGAEGRDARIAEAYRIARDEIRYTGVELGEQSLYPRPLDAVSASGYGDCKEKAGVLVRLLSEVDIAAEVALLAVNGMASQPGDYSIDGFDHAIVHVDGRWLDPTATGVPVGVLPAGLHGRRALLVRPDSEGLVSVHQPEIATYTEVRTMHLPVWGEADIVEETRAEGWPALGLVDVDGPIDPEDFTDYVASTYLAEPGGVELSGDGVGEPMVLRIEASGSENGRGQFEKAEAWIDLSAPLSMFASSSLQRLDEERTEPVHLRPVKSELHWRIDGADGLVPLEVPPDAVDAFGPVSVRTEWAIEEEDILVTVAVDSGDGRLTADEARAFGKWIAREPLEATVGFVAAPYLAAQQGDVVGAVAQARALREAHPDELAYVGLHARLLAQIGLPEAAEAELAGALAAHPDEPLLHDWLGQVRMFDPLGREMHTGFDERAAADALRRAVELDPENLELRRHLGLVLLFDEEQVRWSATAPLAEAIEHLSLAVESDPGLAIDLVMAHYISGQPEEAVAVARDYPSAAQAPIFLAALTAAEGVAALRSHLRSSGLGDPAAASAIAKALAAVMPARDYETFALLVAELNRLSPGSRDAMRDRMAERMRRHEGLELAPHQAALRDSMLAIHDVELREVVARRVRSPERLFDAPEEGMRGMSVDVAVDFTLALSDWPLVDEAVGARVDVPDGRGNATSLYFVHERGAWHVRAPPVDELGHEVLWRLKKKDLAGARQWAEWGVELTGRGGAWHPLGQLWAVLDPTDADALALVGTILARTSPDPRVDWPELDALTEEQQLLAWDALGAAAFTAQRGGDLVHVAEQTLALDPTEGRRTRLSMALGTAGRSEQALAALGDPGEDFDKRLLELSLLIGTERTEAMLESARGLAERVTASDVRFNEVSWALYFGTEADRARGLAIAEQLAAQGASEPGFVHTLALHQIAAGQHAQGLATMRRIGRPQDYAAELAGLRGIIAEDVGYPDVARALYASARGEGKPPPHSAATDAEARLHALDARSAR